MTSVRSRRVVAATVAVLTGALLAVAGPTTAPARATSPTATTLGEGSMSGTWTMTPKSPVSAADDVTARLRLRTVDGGVPAGTVQFKAFVLGTVQDLGFAVRVVDGVATKPIGRMSPGQYVVLGYYTPAEGSPYPADVFTTELTVTTATGATVETIPVWDGVEEIKPFGLPGTRTFGQVITVPIDQHRLDTFTLEARLPSGLGFRGALYAWDEATSRATGPALFESAPRHTSQGTTFEDVVFDTGGVPVTPGGTYVAFVSTAADLDQPAATGGLGVVDGLTYARGTTVYQASASPASWTGATWSAPGLDLAFRVTFGDVLPPAVHGLEPTLTGRAQVGQVLTAHPGAVEPSSATLAYAWFADGEPVPGVDGPSLPLGRDLAGKHVTVQITATKNGYASQTATSDPTSYVRELHAGRVFTVSDETPRPGSTITLLGQGLTPGATYTVVAFGAKKMVVADEYGEIHVPVKVPARFTGPAPLTVVGTQPVSADTLLVTVGR